MPRVDAVLTAGMVSFLVDGLAAVAVFYAPGAMRAWVGLVIAPAPPALVLILLRGVRGLMALATLLLSLSLRSE